MAQINGINWLPCPFCGSKDIHCHSHVHGRNTFNHNASEIVYTMCCYTCGATRPPTFSLASLIKNWNTRTTLENSNAKS